MVKGIKKKSVEKKSARFPLVGLLHSSSSSIAKGWPFLLLSILSDFLFLICAGVLITVIQFRLYEHLEAVMRMAGEMTGGLMNVLNQTETVSKGMVGLQQSLEFQEHINTIFTYLGLMIVAVFLLWSLFEFLSWYCAYRISNDKRLPFIISWKNFILQSLPFYLLTVLWTFLEIRLLFAIKTSITPVIGETTINYIFISLTVITWYFGTICLTLTSKSAYENFKQSFIIGVKKFFSIAQSWLVIILLFIIIDLVLRISIFKNDPILMLLAGIVLFLPVVAFARVILFKTVDVYKNE